VGAVLALLALALLSMGCATTRQAWEWTGTTEALLMGQGADVVTTIIGVETGATELNPLMLDDADEFSYERFLLWKLAVTGSIWGLGEAFPSLEPTLNRIGFVVGAGGAGWNTYGAVKH
jgi:hypothetical protein